MKGNQKSALTFRTAVVLMVSIMCIVSIFLLCGDNSSSHRVNSGNNVALNTFHRAFISQQKEYLTDKHTTAQKGKSEDKGEKEASHPPASSQTSDHPIRIAYIFAGSARSFKCPKVHWSLRLNVIDAFGGDPYVFVRISEEDNQNVKTGNGIVWKPSYGDIEVNETLKILNPRKVEYFSLSNQEDEMKRNFPQTIHRIFRENDKRRYSMFYHRCMGYRLAQEFEKEHKIRFDWVTLIRLDAAWLDPVLPIQYYANDRVWLTETGYVAFNDQFMLIPRQFSDYLYDLNTKVTKQVYCLGGPDLERWKCDPKELSKKKYSQSVINETLAFCCADVLGGNYLGYSETIHYRHLLQGKIPVSMAHFTVFITRYTTKRVCYADCPRLHYHYKDYATEVLTKKYPYWKTDNLLDSSHVTISTTDGGRCVYLNHGSFHWKPISASELHHLIRNGKAQPIDYSQNLYSQWENLHPSLRHNPNNLLQWRIHASGNADGCLTADFGTSSLSWDSCSTHFVLKSGRRINPRQSFHLNIIPHDRNILKHPFLRDEDQIFDFSGFSRSSSLEYNVTQLQIFARTDHFDLQDRALCLTVTSNKPVANPRSAELQMKPCSKEFSDPNQLFHTIQGVATGVHPYSTLGLIKPIVYPNFCLIRDENALTGWNPLVVSNKLTFAKCVGNNVESAGRMYFEFELIAPL